VYTRFTGNAGLVNGPLAPQAPRAEGEDWTDLVDGQINATQRADQVCVADLIG
jgi:hypothetical protein